MIRSDLRRLTVNDLQFEEFFRQQFPRLVHFAARSLGTDVGEDVALRTLEKVWSKHLPQPSSDQERDHLERLGFAIARGLIRNELRSQRRRSLLHRKVEHDAAIAANTEAQVGTEGALPAWVSDVPRADQELLFWLAQGFTVAEIAGIMGCSPAAARKRLSRIRTRIASQVISRDGQFNG